MQTMQDNCGGTERGNGQIVNYCGRTLRSSRLQSCGSLLAIARTLK